MEGDRLEPEVPRRGIRGEPEVLGLEAAEAGVAVEDDVPPRPQPGRGLCVPVPVEDPLAAAVEGAVEDLGVGDQVLLHPHVVEARLGPEPQEQAGAADVAPDQVVLGKLPLQELFRAEAEVGRRAAAGSGSG